MKIFLSKDVIEEIMVFKDNYPNLSAIFSSNSQMIFDMTNEELDKILSNSESDLSQIIRGYDISHEAQKGILDYYKKNINETLKEPRSLFFMDIDKSKAESLSKDYGVMILSASEPDDLIFNHARFKYRLNKGDILSGTVQDVWLQIFSEMKTLPMNSLVISDSYLFDYSDIEDSVKNIEGMLDLVLPKEFKDTFHVLFFSNEMHKEKNVIDKAIGDIKAYINSRRPYPILIEYVFYKALHQRKIISNYDTIVFDKGFVVFKTVSNKQVKTIDTNYINCSAVYDNAADSLGMTGYDIVSEDLGDLKKLYEECKDVCLSQHPDSQKRILGTNNKVKNLNNRLINCVDN